MKRVVFTIGGVLLAWVVLVIILGSRDVSTVLRYLLVGWCDFLQRTLPQMTWNWSVIGTGLFCSIIIILGGHWLSSWLYGEFQRQKRPEQPVQRWRWKWTFSGYAAVWLLFAIAFGSGGVYRHATWLMQEELPWYQAQREWYWEISMANGQMLTLLKGKPDVEQARTAFLAEKSKRHPESLICEEYNVIFYANNTNQVIGYAIIPRNPSPKQYNRMLMALTVPQFSSYTAQVTSLSDVKSTLDEFEGLYLRNLK